MGLLGNIANSMISGGQAGAPSTPGEAKAGSGIETRTLTIDTHAAFGRPHKDLKKLQALLEDGWEIVSESKGAFGTRQTHYVLKRAR